jgi:hypothetical protein
MQEGDLLEWESNLRKMTNTARDVNDVFPKVLEKHIPLTATGIAPRVFSHWKTQQIVNNVTVDGRTWVKLNLYDYVWVMLCKELREFGLPFEVIKKVKETLFQNMFRYIIENKDEIINHIRSNIKNPDENEKKLKMFLDIFPGMINMFSEDQEIFMTLFGMNMSEILLNNQRVALYVTREKDEFEVFMAPDSAFDIYKGNAQFFNRPILRIPVNNIVYEFLEEEKTESYLMPLGILSEEEKTVVDLIRSRDFKEITIIRCENGELQTEVIKRLEFRNEKVKEIQRLLGLKDYQEIRLTKRNDKHIYATVKNEIRKTR